MTTQKSSVATAVDAKANWINYIRKLLEDLLSQFSTVIDVINTNIAKQGVQELITVADGSPEVDNQQAVALNEEEVAQYEEHMEG